MGPGYGVPQPGLGQPAETGSMHSTEAANWKAPGLEPVPSTTPEWAENSAGYEFSETPPTAPESNFDQNVGTDVHHEVGLAAESTPEAEPQLSTEEKLANTEAELAVAKSEIAALRKDFDTLMLSNVEVRNELARTNQAVENHGNKVIPEALDNAALELSKTVADLLKASTVSNNKAFADLTRAIEELTAAQAQQGGNTITAEIQAPIESDTLASPTAAEVSPALLTPDAIIGAPDLPEPLATPVSPEPAKPAESFDPIFGENPRREEVVILSGVIARSRTLGSELDAIHDKFTAQLDSLGSLAKDGSIFEALQKEYEDARRSAFVDALVHDKPAQEALAKLPPVARERRTSDLTPLQEKTVSGKVSNWLRRRADAQQDKLESKTSKESASKVLKVGKFVVMLAVAPQLLRAGASVADIVSGDHVSAVTNAARGLLDVHTSIGDAVTPDVVNPYAVTSTLTAGLLFKGEREAASYATKRLAPQTSEKFIKRKDAFVDRKKEQLRSSVINFADRTASRFDLAAERKVQSNEEKRVAEVAKAAEISRAALAESDARAAKLLADKAEADRAKAKAATEAAHEIDFDVDEKDDGVFGVTDASKGLEPGAVINAPTAAELAAQAENARKLADLAARLSTATTGDGVAEVDG
jgi:hypothetical protein